MDRLECWVSVGVGLFKRDLNQHIFPDKLARILKSIYFSYHILRFMGMKRQACFYYQAFGLIINDLGRLAQLVRASRSHREGHWFKSSNVHQMHRPINAWGGLTEIYKPARKPQALARGEASLKIKTRRGVLIPNELPLRLNQPSGSH
jgi:hypothetical protein